jgi:hypothetical protein
MVIRTYFDKNNTIVNNLNVNTGLNPVSELFYGGAVGEEQYSRLLFHFDENRLKSLYTGGTFTDLTKLKHTLRLTNTGSFDTDLLNGTMGGKERACSFDLILFKVSQDWDNGVGYDYEICNLLNGDCAFSNSPSNWLYAQTAISWTGGTGVYSGSPSGITVSTQHFDKGNENIEMDITDYVNGLLTGDTNYGLGIAYARSYELLSTSSLQYVGFFTNNTQTFYEPFVETIYDNHIQDDRNNFFMDKNNKLYLYVNLAGNPTNLDMIPSVTVNDQDGVLFSAYTSADVTHVTKGVYSIDIQVPTNANNYGTMYNDIWSDIVINGVVRPDIELSFVMNDSMGYYNIGNNDMLPAQVAVSIGGIQNKEKIKRGDIRKAIVSARIPYTVEQTQNISGLKYRIYVAEGTRELTVIDFQPVEMANNYYYFLLDTASLIPNTYYLDVLATSNEQVTTLKNVLTFEIVNQVELRKGQ